VKLTINEYHISALEWGENTSFEDGLLTINKKAVLDFVKGCDDLVDIELTDMDLIHPKTSTRIVNIFDVLPAHARLGKNSNNFPGFIDPMQTVGDGISAALKNFSLLAISSLPGRYNKVLDKDGVGAALSPYSSHFNLAFKAQPKRGDLSQSDYYALLKKMGLKIGIYLAEIAAQTSEATNVSVFSLEKPSSELPRAVYVCMLASLQLWDKGEPILYGNDLLNMIPTILHPNEFLDGCMVAQNFNLGIDTYSFLNNPVILELYERHGKELDFAGVVVCASHAAHTLRELSVQMICKLTKDILGADIATMTKLGGGIPESDVMSTMDNLEKRGVVTTPIIWSHWGDGTIKDILTIYPTAANAMVSVGINDAMLYLPEQERIVGGEVIAPLSDDPGAAPMPAEKAIEIRCREFSGAINQLGASVVALKEI
jgi:glycine reductase